MRLGLRRVFARKKTVKRGALAFLALCVAGFAALNVLAYNHAHAMTHFTSGGTRTSKPEGLALGTKIQLLLTGVTLPRPASTRIPSDLAPQCRVRLSREMAQSGSRIDTCSTKHAPLRRPYSLRTMSMHMTAARMS